MTGLTLRRQPRLESSADVLRTARERIARGWAKQSFTVGGRVCALGGINYAWWGDPDEVQDGYENDPTARLLVEAIREQYPDRTNPNYNTVFATISYFNDHDDTTQDDVLTVFDKAILRAEEIR